MLLPIQVKADRDVIKSKRQAIITKSNKCGNKKHIPHTYSVGDKSMLEKPSITKIMLKPQIGQHTVTKLYSNGTLKIKRGLIQECVNILCVTPYRDDPQTVREANAVCQT